MRSIPQRNAPPASPKALALIGVAICLPMVAAIVTAVVVHENRQRAVIDVPLEKQSHELRDLHQGWIELGALAAHDPPAVGPESAPSSPNLRSGITINEPTNPASESKLEPNSSSAASAAPAMQAVPSQPSAVASGDARGSPPLGTSGNGAQAAGIAAASARPAASARAPAVEPPGPPCGKTVCPAGKVCCNASCGTCTDPGQKCSQQVCGMNAATESVACGANTCNVGQVCCNASCGTCAPPGQTCDTKPCDSAIQYPVSPPCGMSTCNVGTVCCNPSCGICAPPGEPCSQAACN